MSEEKLDLILKVFSEIRDKMNEFGAETNLNHEFRGFRIDINNLESKLLIEQAETIRYNLKVRELESKVAKLEEKFKLAA